MSISSLPKELRRQIWALAYHAEPPRLVALRTMPHVEDHDETTFCPRYSPSPAPLIVNICHEARAEAHHQARKAGHLVRHHVGLLGAPIGYSKEYFFRFETDILYVPLEDEHVKHFDESPENGLLEHFRISIEDARLLRNIAVTDVIKYGFDDGSLSNVLRHFTNISRVIMMVPQAVLESKPRRERFVRAASRIVRLYRIDKIRSLENDVKDGTHEVRHYVEFAKLVNGELKIIPEQEWAM